MRVTLKTVNEKLKDLGSKAELAKGAGYFLFRAAVKPTTGSIEQSQCR